MWLFRWLGIAIRLILRAYRLNALRRSVLGLWQRRNPPP
jgi:hypothetical protein